MAEPTPNDARHLDRQWLKQHLADERKEAEWLGEIREALFGMQDGLVSTLAVVSTVGAASGDRFAVLVAGIASALAGVFSMAAGEYMSSKSQREIYVAQIENEREEVRDRPAEAEAEVAYMLESEGLSEAAARRVAAELAREFVPMASAPVASIVLCVLVVFGIGAVKSRWTKRDPIRSGLEVVALAAFAGIAGYLFGSVLPSVLGFAGLGPL